MLKGGQSAPVRNWQHLFGAFRRQQSGAVAIIFALAIIPIVMLTGVAIDYSRATSARSKLQQALDAATLKAVTNFNDAASVLQVNLAGAGLSGVTSNWITNPDGSVTGVASGQLDSTMLGVLGVDSLNVSTSATATLKSVATMVPNSATFNMKAAKGWAWKQLQLYVHSSGTSSDTLLASWTYQPIDQNYVLSAAQMAALSWSDYPNGPGTLTGPTTSVSLGSNYEYAYLTMLVSYDGCPPDQTPSASTPEPSSNLVCVAATQAWPKTSVPYSFNTMDAATINHLFYYVNSAEVQMASVTQASFLMPCGQQRSFAWEDTQAFDGLGVGAWATQDFFYSVTSVSCATDSAYQTSTPALVR
ncbi:MAG: TadE/TadG family type IV pilus assembly protein [Methylocystis sp.]